jgi:FMN phosphatase YigB (HAD superfamily)
MVECSGGHRTTDKYEESMIKNIVFDLGNVLVSFRPEEYFTQNGYAEEAKKVIINDIFRSREWHMLDNGDITIDEAIREIGMRSLLKTEEIVSVFNLRTKIIFPIIGNTLLLPALQIRGFNLYYLSNFPDDIFDEVFNKYDFFRYFNGGIISARVKASKPERRIFEILQEMYSLSPGECLFIDDSEQNVNAAKLFGMNVIHVEKPQDLPEQLEKALGRF